MPLLCKASDGASASRARSPVKGGGHASPTARPASSKGGGGRAGAGGGGEAGRKAPTLLPAQAQQGVAPAADDYAVPIREVVRPHNQLQLSAAELEEEVGRSLTAGNPSAPASLVRYSYKEHAFRPEPIIDQQLQHLALGGSLMHRDSDEAARDRHRRESNALLAHSRRVTAASRRVTAAHGGEAGAGGPVRPSELGGALRAEASVGPAAADSEGGPRLHNQFNCADRGAQTGHRRPRDRGTMTEPPPTATASGSCSRWEIYEAYVADQERQRQTEELARQKAQAARREARVAHTAAVGQQPGRAAGAAGALALPGEDEVGGMASLAPLSGQAAKLMERMVQQNLHCEMGMDFKYWDDPADAVKPDEGTLMPLWSFTNDRAKSRAVTAIAWSPRYFDMFAVGYGSFDFLKPTTGLVSVYSLKNPGHPEFSFSTAAGVMCLDFHPEHPALLAVGCYDGHIAIFDVRMGSCQPLYRSTPRSGKHADPVWQVAWQRTAGHELQLASISTDGRVTLWTVSRNELQHQDLMELRRLRGRDQGDSGSGAEPSSSSRPATCGSSGSHATAAVQGAGEEAGAGIAGGCCFDFNREQETLFVVGAEDGSLYKCSTAYTSEYLQAYRPGHQLPVYAVRWNGLHSRTFLSAGADWKVKLWDALQPKPVLSFDLGAPVGDVAWAPQSSTVFAAATDSGHVHVFDVAHSRAAAVCVQKVARKTRLTKLAFNSRHAVLLVGTEHGGVLCLKLSPNLRRSFNPGTCPDASDSRAVVRTDSQRAAARAAEAVRLEAVLVAAAKCNAALREEDMALL